MADASSVPTRRSTWAWRSGRPRPDGFHALSTLYQTLRLHDLVTRRRTPGTRTRIRLHARTIPRVPRDARNTAWKMVEQALAAAAASGARCNIHIEKNLPVQGGMGAGSANAAAALLGLERELGLGAARAERRCRTGGRGGLGCAAVPGGRGGAGIRPRATGGDGVRT